MKVYLSTYLHTLGMYLVISLEDAPLKNLITLHESFYIVPTYVLDILQDFLIA